MSSMKSGCEDGVCFEPLNPELVIVKVKEEHDFEEESAVKNELSSADEEEASDAYLQDAGLTMRRFDGEECLKEEEVFVKSEFGSCAGPDASVDNNDEDGVCFKPLNPELVIVKVKEEHDFEEESAVKNELSSADEEEASYTDWQDAGLTMRRFDGEECLKEEEVFVKSEFGSCAGPDASVDNNDGKKSYPCTICHYKATQLGTLSRHMRTHTGEKPYPCKLCDYKATRPGNLSRHMRTHKGEKPYPCKVCDYKATQPEHLSRHMRTHTGETPYPCKLCTYKATHPGHLSRHMRTHTGEKPYSCTLCDYKAAQPGNLTRHMGVHTGEKSSK